MNEYELKNGGKELLSSAKTFHKKLNNSNEKNSMFLVILRYQKSMEEVTKYLEEHIVFLEKYYELNKFICSGRQDPRIGGIILSSGKDKEEVNSMIKEDPFYKNNIAKYEIIEFIPTKYRDGFEKFILG